MKLYDYICVVCKSPFQNRKKDKKYCSIACVSKHRAEQRLANKNNSWREEIRNCFLCNMEFSPTYSPQRYCSRSCFMKVRGIEKTKNQTYETKCGWCNKDFKKRLSQKGKTGDFCSIKCGEAFKRGAYEKYITKECLRCKKLFITLYRKQTEHCSRMCASLYQLGEEHIGYGKEGPTKGMKPWTYGLTKETDNRIAELAEKISQTHKQQFELGIRSNKKENNPNWGKTRKDRTPEQLENYSKAATERVLDGSSCNWKNFKTGHFLSKKNSQKIFYRSSYELRLMRCLERAEDVVCYIHEPFQIKFSGNQRYVPDFLVYFKNGEKKLFEAKGFDWHGNIDLKTKSAIEYCEKNNICEYKIFYKNDIKTYEQQLGLIND